MKLSVRIITYNHAAFIRQAMDSVLAQKTNFNFEIIIGDDGSTDETPQILKSYETNYPDKIKLNLHPQNLGGRKNLLSTLSSCTGEYVAFMDGDDYWSEENKLEKQINFLDSSPEYSICFHNAEIIKTFDPDFSANANKFDVQIFNTEDIIKRNWFMMNSSLVMRNPNPLPEWLYNPVNKNIDYSLHLLMSLKGKVYYIPEVMSVYRLHNKSLALNFDLIEWCDSLHYILDNFDHYTKNKYQDLTKDKHAAVCLRIVKEYSFFSSLFLKNLIAWYRYKQNVKFKDFKEITLYLLHKYYNKLKP